MTEIDKELIDRKGLAQMLLASGIDPIDLQMEPQLDQLPASAALTADLGIDFPDGLAPVPTEPLPSTTANTTKKLPKVDVVAITWTVDEQDALADVLTPGFARKTWTRYNRNFDAKYKPQIRPGAPALAAGRMGSWCLTQIGEKTVLCFKSELHLNQDGIRDAVAPGIATLPVKDLFQQIIEEANPDVVITVGTSGGLFKDHDLGDIAVTRAAKFRCKSEFKNLQENLDETVFKSEWEIPRTHFAKATELMQGFKSNLDEEPLPGPTVLHTGGPINPRNYVPDIKQEGFDGIPEFHPILTTDFFEYGTSTNKLDEEGIAVEMGDAVLGMVATEMGNDAPNWVVVRNLSDPQINGELEKALGDAYAVWYYKKYGYWTSVMSALTTWAIIAGL
jgi:hypothetical protein